MKTIPVLKLSFLVLAMVVLIGSKGQSVCDSVIVSSISYTPFADTAIQLNIHNNSSDIFNYPGFILFDQNGDTLAKEIVNFFGIATESMHELVIYPNATIPMGPFTATLELWTGFYQQLACTWNLTVDLCPTDTCTIVTINIGNFGSALINSSFDWMITDTLSNSLANGTFFMADTIQSDFDDFCLPPGEYLYWVDSPQPTGGQPYYGISAGLNNYSMPLIQGGGDQSIPFTLFEQCIDVSQSVANQFDEQSSLIIYSQNGILMLGQKAGQKIGNVEIFDLNGRMIFSKDFITNEASIDLREHPTGIYIVRSNETNKTQCFFLK